MPKTEAGWLGVTRRVGTWLLQLPPAVALALPLAWMAMIWTMSGVSSDDTELFEHVPSFWFNLAHAGEFGILALLLLPNLPRRSDADRPLLPRRAGLIVVLIVLAYALLDEWHQLFVPGRVASLWDVLTDVVGAICVMSVAAFAWSSRATERGLRWRYFAGLVACVAAAGLSTTAGRLLPELHLEKWPDSPTSDEPQ